MKQRVMVSLLLMIICGNLYAQKKNYLDCSFKKTSLKKAFFVIETTGKENNRYNRSVYLVKNHQLLEKGFYTKEKNKIYTRNGWFIYYNDANKKASQGYYLNGEKDGKWTYFDSTENVFMYKDFEKGNVIKTYYELKHLVNGKVQKFDSMGRVLSSYSISNFMKNDYCAEYYPNRQLKMKGFYQNDTPKKSWYYYSPKGKLTELRQYKNDGTIDKQFIYDSLILKELIDPAVYLGGEKCFLNFVASFNRPDRNNKAGTYSITVRFRIDIDGSIIDVKWENPSSDFILSKLFEHSKKTLLSTPPWRPYRINNVTKTQFFLLPFIYKFP